MRSRPSGWREYWACGSRPIFTPRRSAMNAASCSVYLISTKSSSSVVHFALMPSSVLTTGTPISAATRIASLMYSPCTSGRPSGPWDCRPEIFSPARSQASLMR